MLTATPPRGPGGRQRPYSASSPSVVDENNGYHDDQSVNDARRRSTTRHTPRSSIASSTSNMAVSSPLRETRVNGGAGTQYLRKDFKVPDLHHAVSRQYGMNGSARASTSYSRDHQNNTPRNGDRRYRDTSRGLMTPPTSGSNDDEHDEEQVQRLAPMESTPAHTHKRPATNGSAVTNGISSMYPPLPRPSTIGERSEMSTPGSAASSSRKRMRPSESPDKSANGYTMRAAQVLLRMGLADVSNDRSSVSGDTTTDTQDEEAHTRDRVVLLPTSRARDLSRWRDMSSMAGKSASFRRQASASRASAAPRSPSPQVFTLQSPSAFQAANKTATPNGTPRAKEARQSLAVSPTRSMRGAQTIFAPSPLRNSITPSKSRRIEHDGRELSSTSRPPSLRHVQSSPAHSQASFFEHGSVRSLNGARPGEAGSSHLPFLSPDKSRRQATPSSQMPTPPRTTTIRRQSRSVSPLRNETPQSQSRDNAQRAPSTASPYRRENLTSRFSDLGQFDLYEQSPPTLMQQSFRVARRSESPLKAVYQSSSRQSSPAKTHSRQHTEEHVDVSRTPTRGQQHDSQMSARSIDRRSSPARSQASQISIRHSQATSSPNKTTGSAQKSPYRSPRLTFGKNEIREHLQEEPRAASGALDSEREGESEVSPLKNMVSNRSPRRSQVDASRTAQMTHSPSVGVSRYHASTSQDVTTDAERGNVSALRKFVMRESRSTNFLEQHNVTDSVHSGSPRKEIEVDESNISNVDNRFEQHDADPVSDVHGPRFASKSSSQQQVSPERNAIDSVQGLQTSDMVISPVSDPHLPQLSEAQSSDAGQRSPSVEASLRRSASRLSRMSATPRSLRRQPASIHSSPLARFSGRSSEAQSPLISPVRANANIVQDIEVRQDSWNNEDEVIRRSSLNAINVQEAQVSRRSPARVSRSQSPAVNNLATQDRETTLHNHLSDSEEEVQYENQALIWNGNQPEATPPPPEALHDGFHKQNLVHQDAPQMSAEKANTVLNVPRQSQTGSASPRKTPRKVLPSFIPVAARRVGSLSSRKTLSSLHEENRASRQQLWRQRLSLTNGGIRPSEHRSDSQYAPAVGQVTMQPATQIQSFAADVQPQGADDVQVDDMGGGDDAHPSDAQSDNHAINVIDADEEDGVDETQGSSWIHDFDHESAREESQLIEDEDGIEGVDQRSYDGGVSLNQVYDYGAASENDDGEQDASEAGGYGEGEAQDGVYRAQSGMYGTEGTHDYRHDGEDDEPSFEEERGPESDVAGFEHEVYGDDVAEAYNGSAQDYDDEAHDNFAESEHGHQDHDDDVQQDEHVFGEEEGYEQAQAYDDEQEDIDGEEPFEGQDFMDDADEDYAPLHLSDQHSADGNFVPDRDSASKEEEDCSERLVHVEKEAVEDGRHGTIEVDLIRDDTSARSAQLHRQTNLRGSLVDTEPREVSWADVSVSDAASEAEAEEDFVASISMERGALDPVSEHDTRTLNETRRSVHFADDSRLSVPSNTPARPPRLNDDGSLRSKSTPDNRQTSFGQGGSVYSPLEQSARNGLLLKARMDTSSSRHEDADEQQQQASTSLLARSRKRNSLRIGQLDSPLGNASRIPLRSPELPRAEERSNAAEKTVDVARERSTSSFAGNASLTMLNLVRHRSEMMGARPSMVEVCSLNREAAARAAAILKQHHKYVQYGSLEVDVDEETWNQTALLDPSLVEISQHDATDAELSRLQDTLTDRTMNDVLREKEAEIIRTGLTASQSDHLSAGNTSLGFATPSVPGAFPGLTSRPRSSPKLAALHLTRSKAQAKAMARYPRRRGRRLDAFGKDEWASLDDLLHAEVLARANEILLADGDAKGDDKSAALLSAALLVNQGALIELFLDLHGLAPNTVAGSEWSLEQLSRRVAVLIRRFLRKLKARYPEVEVESFEMDSVMDNSRPATPRLHAIDDTTLAGSPKRAPFRMIVESTPAQSQQVSLSSSLGANASSRPSSSQSSTRHSSAYPELSERNMHRSSSGRTDDESSESDDAEEANDTWRHAVIDASISASASAASLAFKGVGLFGSFLRSRISAIADVNATTASLSDAQKKKKRKKEKKRKHSSKIRSSESLSTELAPTEMAEVLQHSVSASHSLPSIEVTRRAREDRVYGAERNELADATQMQENSFRPHHYRVERPHTSHTNTSTSTNFLFNRSMQAEMPHHTPVRRIASGQANMIEPTALAMLSPHTHREARDLAADFRASREARKWRSPRKARTHYGVNGGSGSSANATLGGMSSVASMSRLRHDISGSVANRSDSLHHGHDGPARATWPHASTMSTSRPSIPSQGPARFRNF